MKDTIWVCADCGSRDVDCKTWIGVNTREIKGDLEDATTYYCCECEIEVDIIDLDDYKTVTND